LSRGRSGNLSFFPIGADAFMLEERSCPECGATYDPRTSYCQKDGNPLVITKTLIGKVLHGRYRIDDWIGGGGMAMVYCATHLRMGERVAVKVLNPDLVGKERLADRFRNEARAAMRINHQNAIKVTDFDITDDNLHYLVMEIVQGRLLRDLIDEEAFNYRRAVKILSQACEAIDAAHKQGIIHRDLKPDNIIIQDLGGAEKVKVLDFGIARLRESDNPNSSKAVLTAAGIVLGTPQYMSPEQCESQELGPAADVYSIGIIAYEMLTQRTPFVPSNDLRDFFHQIKYDLPPPLRLFVTGVPPSIERVILRSLAKDPADRQPTPLILAHELRKAVKEGDGGTTDPTVAATTVVVKSRVDTAPVTSQREIFTAKTVDLPANKHTNQSWVRTRYPIAVAAGLALSLFIYSVFFREPALPQPAVNPATISDEFGEMVFIRGDKFIMGYSKGDEDEQPEHETVIGDYYLDKYEITNQQYKKFVEATGHRAPKHWVNGSFQPEEARLPVTHVEWADADAYAKWAKKRLPTEAEWEYAARSGRSDFIYPWGTEWKQGYANVERRSSRPAPVHSVENDRNLFGVYDLVGNVSEWVQDDYLGYLRKEPLSNCQGCKVFRGGNFVDEIKDGRASKRWAIFLNVPQEFAEAVFPRVGFRCARNPQ
jgi:serine/threonine-protein kinase